MPSMSATERPASARALRLASAARLFVDAPEPRANAVQPIPAMAVFALMLRSILVAKLERVPVKLRHQRRDATCVLPPPLWGRVGEGGPSRCAGHVNHSLPPPLTPPHKGEGNRPVARRRCAQTSPKHRNTV